MDNYIYVLKFNKAVKIGKTNNLDRRIKQHKTSNPFSTLIYTKSCDEKYEKYIHKKLKNYLIEGSTEWFEYYDSIIEDIDYWLSLDIYFDFDTKKDIEIISNMKFKGITNKEIGQNFGVTEGAVRKWLKKYSIKPKIKNYNINDVVKLKENGHTNVHIASVFSISEGYVRKLLKNNSNG